MGSGVGQPPADATAPKPRQPIDAWGCHRIRIPAQPADANTRSDRRQRLSDSRGMATGQYQPKRS